MSIEAKMQASAIQNKNIVKLSKGCFLSSLINANATDMQVNVVLKYNCEVL